MPKPRYRVDTVNGRFKIYIDNYVFLSFNQIDFKGYYAFKDDLNLYGIDFYVKECPVIETSYKTKQTWLDILKVLDDNL